MINKIKDLILDCPACYKTHLEMALNRLHKDAACDCYVCGELCFSQILSFLLYYYKNSDVTIYLKKEREDLDLLKRDIDCQTCFYYDENKIVQKGRLVKKWNVIMNRDQESEGIVVSGCPHPSIVHDSNLVIKGLPEQMSAPNDKLWKFELQISSIQNPKF